MDGNFSGPSFVSSLPFHPRADKRLYGHTHTNHKLNPQFGQSNMHEFSVLECCYPASFFSNNNEISARLQVLSCTILRDSVRRFSANIPSSQRMKASLTDLIMSDFSRQTTELVKLSTEELHKLASPPAGYPRFLLPLVCHLVHERYGPVVAPQLLCEPTRWNPPELMEGDAIVASVNWLQVPIDGLKSRLSKVDSSVIKMCCDLYLSPNPTPRSKTEKYGVIAERFRFRSLFLFHLSDVEFPKNHVNPKYRRQSTILGGRVPVFRLTVERTDARLGWDSD